MQLAVDERADFIRLLEDLAPQEWEQPSLCEGWRVRDVAAHVISYDVLGPAATAGRFLRGMTPSRVNAIGVEKAKALTTEQIVEQFRTHRRPTGLTAAMDGGLALTDGLIHQQDIRRALDRPRQIPAERLAAVLPFALKAPTLPGRRLARGLTLVATDLDFRRGAGPEVSGPAEALVMACAGRGVAVDDLTGDGVPTLLARL